MFPTELLKPRLERGATLIFKINFGREGEWVTAA